MKLKSAIIAAAFITIPFSASCQYNWWNKIHNWDGITNWMYYITMSSAYMGANALPVPAIDKASHDTTSSFSVSYDYYKMKGDKTQDIFLQLQLPICDRVSARIEYVPFETYVTDTIIRDIRAARTYSGKGTANGDIYLYTSFQILQDKNQYIDLKLIMGIKTASGNKLEDARYTDTPGYFFNISIGKKYQTNGLYCELYSLLGFYSYQTNRSDYYQNDLIVYGAGFDIRKSAFMIKNIIGGYYGYIGNGDRPVVYRLYIEYLLKKFSLNLRFQQGLNDYFYTNFRFGFSYYFSQK